MVSVSLYASELPGGFQSFGSIDLHVTEPLGGLQTMVSVIALLVYREAPGMSSSSDDFTGADKLVLSCSVAHLLCVQQFSWDASGCGCSCTVGSGSSSMDQSMVSSGEHTC